MGERGALEGATLAFVGAGVMAESMIAGLLNRGLVQPEQVIASHPREDRRERLVKRFGIRVTESNETAATGADLVLLTIKPQVLSGVMKQLRGKLEPAEVFHQLLEHRWYLSQDEDRDVPLAEAVTSYIDNVLRHRRDEATVIDQPTESITLPIALVDEADWRDRV